MISHWTTVKNELLGDCGSMEIISSDRVTLCKFKIRSKSSLPSHSHENEQISYVLKGQMKLRAGNEEHILKPGDVRIIPASVIHSVEIMDVPFESIDIFNPIRQDFINRVKK